MTLVRVVLSVDVLEHFNGDLNERLSIILKIFLTIFLWVSLKEIEGLELMGRE